MHYAKRIRIFPPRHRDTKERREEEERMFSYYRLCPESVVTEQVLKKVRLSTCAVCVSLGKMLSKGFTKTLTPQEGLGQNFTQGHTNGTFSPNPLSSISVSRR